MGLQQPSAAAATGALRRLELPDADSPARAEPSRTFSRDAAGTGRKTARRGRIRRRHSPHRNPPNGGVIDCVVGIADVPTGDSRRRGHFPGKPLSPLRIEGSDPCRAGPALLRRPRSHRRNRPREIGPSRLALCRRQRSSNWDLRSPGARYNTAPPCRCRFMRRRAQIRNSSNCFKTPPTAVQQAMLQTLRAGRWSGYIDPTSTCRHWPTGSARP